jgi:hypothetical protein
MGCTADGEILKVRIVFVMRIATGDEILQRTFCKYFFVFTIEIKTLQFIRANTISERILYYYDALDNHTDSYISKSISLGN